jgi:hypothetical protein
LATIARLGTVSLFGTAALLATRALFATRALKERLKPFAVVARGPTAAALRLAALRFGGKVAGTLRASRPEAEAAEYPLKLTAFLQIWAFRLPPHRLPAVEKRTGLVARPAKFLENIGSTRIDRGAQVFEGEVCRVAGVLKLL